MSVTVESFVDGAAVGRSAFSHFQERTVKRHIFRRGGVVHISREAAGLFDFVAGLPTDIDCLGAQLVCLRCLLEDPSPRISQRTLAGIATCVDVLRLMVAAIPSPDINTLDHKRILLSDNEPLMSAPELIPLLVHGSVVSDEFRLGLRTPRSTAN